MVKKKRDTETRKLVVNELVFPGIRAVLYLTLVPLGAFALFTLGRIMVQYLTYETTARLESKVLALKCEQNGDLVFQIKYGYAHHALAGGFASFPDGGTVIYTGVGTKYLKYSYQENKVYDLGKTAGTDLSDTIHYVNTPVVTATPCSMTNTNTGNPLGFINALGKRVEIPYSHLNLPSEDTQKLPKLRSSDY